MVDLDLTDLFTSSAWRIVLVLCVPIAVACFGALSWGAQRSVLFPARPAPARDVAESIPGLVRLDVGRDEKVEALFFPAAQSGGPAPVLVFAHGNGELIDDWVYDFQTPRRFGMAVLLVEYPGYGRSQGEPSETSIRDSFVRAYDALIRMPNVDPARIVGYGRSLGGGAICQLARERDLAALILESTFTSVRPLARQFGIPKFWVRDPFDNLPVVRSFDGPILLIHGAHDTLIPVENAEALHEAAKQSTLQILPCGHNDCPRSWRSIHAFLNEASILSEEDRDAPTASRKSAEP